LPIVESHDAVQTVGDGLYRIGDRDPELRAVAQQALETPRRPSAS
jgi:hypothetical protein